MLNYYRITQTATGPQDQQVRGNGFFGQDDFNVGRLTFNLGVRAEQLGALRDDRRSASTSSRSLGRRA